MISDIRGLALSGASEAQAADYDAVIQDYLDYQLTAFRRLKPLCAEAPEFAMAHVLKGYLLLSIGTRDTLPGADRCHELVTVLVDDLTQRERSHVNALGAWIKGDINGACRYWDDILVDHPFDLLASKLQHLALFNFGRSAKMRDSLAGILPAWEEDVPGYAQLLGMYAFALEENNHYAEAEHYGREAVERHPDDLWSIHSVAHVFEMQGRLKEGSDWLDHPYDYWDGRNPFKAHLWWHAALFAFERGDFERSLDIYDNAILPDESTIYLDIQNTASLLARLALVGVDVGSRWSDLAGLAHERDNDHSDLFTEPHCAMAFAASGDFAAAQAQVASLRTFAAQAEECHTGATLVEPLFAPLCEAVAHFHKGAYDLVLKLMIPIRHDLQAIGGSHAQRDVFAQYLIAAARGAGDHRLARVLLSERLPRYKNSLNTWQSYAEVCEQLSDQKGVSVAKETLNRLVGAGK